MASDLLGRWGEGIAAEYLRRKRYTIAAANYRCRFGEIDLIAENRKYLIFVEVKLRKNGEVKMLPLAGDYVTAIKDLLKEL